jgi:hypothetical protein
LELTLIERLAWLEARRAEVARLRERMEAAGRAADSELGEELRSGDPRRRAGGGEAEDYRRSTRNGG